jgi:hypothetical protein
MIPTNKYKYFLTFFVLLLLSAGICFSANTGRTDKNKKFQVELYGGISALNPADLNLRPEYAQAYEEYYYLGRYAAEDLRLGDLFNFSFSKDGELRKLKSGGQLGVRVKYLLNRSMAVSVGFRYLNGSQDSNAAFQSNLSGVDPDTLMFSQERTLTRTYSPYNLSARGFTPMVGFHYCWLSTPNLRLESYIAGGPLFAACRFERHLVYREESVIGYWRERTYAYTIEGSGTGFALDAGVRVHVKLYKNIGIFLEGGYSLQRAGDISGKGIYKYTFDDSNAERNTQVSTWEGKWVLVPARLDSSIRYPASEYNAPELEGFSLDLSGFQARIGVSFTF